MTNTRKGPQRDWGSGGAGPRAMIDEASEMFLGGHR